MRIEIDKDKPCKHLNPDLAQRHVAVLQFAIVKFLALHDELVAALQIPAPAVERAPDGTILETAGALSERCTPMGQAL